MTTASGPPRLSLRNAAPAPSAPPWVFLALVLAAVGLVLATLVSDTALLRASIVTFLLMAGAVVLYRPHVGLMVIMSTMLVSYPAALRGIGPFTINNLIGMTLLVVLAVQLYREGDYWFMREPEIRMLLLIAGLLLLTWVLSIFFLPNVKHMLPKIAKARGAAGHYGEENVTPRFFFELVSRIVFTIFFVNWIREPKQLRTVLIVFALCILAVVPSIGVDVARGTSDGRITSKLVGWAQNANRFAFMVNVGIGLFLYLAHVTKSSLLRIGALAGAVACIPLVLLSASRSGFIGLGIVGMTLMRSNQVPRQWKIMGSIGGLLLGILVFFFVLPEASQERLLNLNPFAPAARSEGSHSTEQRVATLEDALTIIGRYPIFGVGLGNFRWFNMYMHGSYKPPHNSYVWSWAEGGIFTTIAYLTLFAFVFARIQRLRERYVKHPVLPDLPDFLNLYVVLLLFFSIFADVWLEVHVYFIVAMSIVLSRWALDEELKARALPGLTANTPAARRAASRALYRPRPPQ